MANDDSTPTSAYLRQAPRTLEDAQTQAARLRICAKVRAFVHGRDMLRQLEAELDRLIAVGKGGAA